MVWENDTGDAFVRQVFADGTAGDEVLLESASQPRVARAPGGEFVVAYRAENTLTLLAQTFDAMGNPVGAEILVSTDDEISVINPDVDMDADGHFVVVWNTLSEAGREIQGRRVSSDGTVQGSVLQIDVGVSGTANEPSVAVADSGRFAVVWTGSQSPGDDQDNTSVQGRVYDSGGQPLGAPFQINTLTTSRQEQPDIAALADGTWVVVWTDQSLQFPLRDIAMQRLDSVGQFLGPQTMVNAYTATMQLIPSVAAYEEGGFVVTWESYGSPGDEALGFSVQGQVFDSLGQFVDEQFQFNSYVPTSQTRVEVGTAPGEGSMMVWVSLTSTGDDTSFSSIQGRQFGPFTPNVFTDGFESGDTLSWSDWSDAQP